MWCSRAHRRASVDHRRVVRGDRRIVSVRQQRLHHPRVRRVDVGLLLIRDRLRFLVGALDEADARAERVHAREILLAAVQRRLQHDADAAGSRAATASRRSRASRRCTASSPCRCARRNPAGSARSRILRRLSTALALSTSRPSCVSFSEMLRPMPDCDDRVDDVEVVARRRVGLVEVRDALAELVERQHQAARFDGARRLDGFLRRFRRR